MEKFWEKFGKGSRRVCEESCTPWEKKSGRVPTTRPRVGGGPPLARAGRTLRIPSDGAYFLVTTCKTGTRAVFTEPQALFRRKGGPGTNKDQTIEIRVGPSAHARKVFFEFRSRIFFPGRSTGVRKILECPRNPEFLAQNLQTRVGGSPGDCLG